ncbi:MAG: hypothetical protein C4538_12055 [Nitrospiraceae bacterium]|nr:MAG: hypothetical protein C4538_12055 [Nitrospiraceae bacterium]
MGVNSENPVYTGLIRSWLVAILFLLPFQMALSSLIIPWSSKLSNAVNMLDELTVVIFLLLSIREYYNHKRILDKTFFFYYPL